MGTPKPPWLVHRPRSTMTSATQRITANSTQMWMCAPCMPVEWLVFYSLTRKWFACHPQPQGATEGPFMGKAQDWSSIWLSTPLSLPLNPTTDDGLKCKEPWCVYEHMCHLFIFRLPTAFMSIWDKCLNFVNIVHFVNQGIKVLSVSLQALPCKCTCQSMIQASRLCTRNCT